MRACPCARVRVCRVWIGTTVCVGVVGAVVGCVCVCVWCDDVVSVLVLLLRVAACFGFVDVRMQVVCGFVGGVVGVVCCVGFCMTDCGRGASGGVLCIASIHCGGVDFVTVWRRRYRVRLHVLGA